MPKPTSIYRMLSKAKKGNPFKVVGMHHIEEHTGLDPMFVPINSLEYLVAKLTREEKTCHHVYMINICRFDQSI